MPDILPIYGIAAILLCRCPSGTLSRGRGGFGNDGFRTEVRTLSRNRGGAGQWPSSSCANFWIYLSDHALSATDLYELLKARQVVCQRGDLIIAE